MQLLHIQLGKLYHRKIWSQRKLTLSPLCMTCLILCNTNYAMSTKASWTNCVICSKKNEKTPNTKCFLHSDVYIALQDSHWGNMLALLTTHRLSAQSRLTSRLDCKHTPVKGNKSVTLVYIVFVLVYHNLYFLGVHMLRLAFEGVQHTISSSIQRIVPFTAD